MGILTWIFIRDVAEHGVKEMDGVIMAFIIPVAIFIIFFGIVLLESIMVTLFGSALLAIAILGLIHSVGFMDRR